MHSEQTPARSFFGRRHFHALFVRLLGAQPSLQHGAVAFQYKQQIRLELWDRDGTTIKDAFLSMAKAHYKKAPRWRAVLRVVGEKGRKYGTKYEDPSLTAKKLLETMGPRIHSSERDRVVEIVKNLVWIELTESCLTYRDLR